MTSAFALKAHQDAFDDALRDAIAITKHAASDARIGAIARGAREMTRIDRAARIFQERASELAPTALLAEIRALIESRQFRILDA